MDCCPTVNLWNNYLTCVENMNVFIPPATCLNIILYENVIYNKCHYIKWIWKPCHIFSHTLVYSLYCYDMKIICTNTWHNVAYQWLGEVVSLFVAHSSMGIIAQPWTYSKGTGCSSRYRPSSLSLSNVGHSLWESSRPMLPQEQFTPLHHIWKAERTTVGDLQGTTRN